MQILLPYGRIIFINYVGLHRTIKLNAVESVLTGYLRN
jgi:hypothetical protein